MVSQVSNFLPLEEMKRELRYENTTEYDTMLTSQIERAVSIISRALDIPIIDVTETISVSTRNIYNTCPIEFYASSLQSVNSIAYWSTDGNLTENPDGTITDLGRLERIRGRGDTYQQWPDADGWPDVLPRSTFQVSVTRGVTQTNSVGLRQACISLVREFFDARPKMPSDESMINYLLNIYREYNG